MNLVRKLLFGLLALGLALASCQKDPDDRLSDELPTLRSNVIVLDSIFMDLYSTEAERAQGIYKFFYKSGFPQIRNGDVIVGDQGNGFLRKITDAKINQDGTILLQTVPASLEEVFAKGAFSFVQTLEGSSPYRSAGILFEFEEPRALFQNDQVSFSIDTGYFQIDPEIQIEFNFEGGKVEKFRFAAQGTEVDAALDFSLQAAAPFSIASTQEVLVGFKKPFTYYIDVQGGPPVPLTGLIYTDFVLEYAADVSGPLEADFALTSSNDLTFGGTFQEEQWIDIYDPAPLLEHVGPFLSDNVPLEWNITMYPFIRIVFYNEGGPFWRAKVHEDTKLSLAGASTNWDLRSEGWLSAEVGGDVSVVGSMPVFARQFKIDSSLLYAPFLVEYVSGNAQTGIWTQPLSEPIVARVRDNLGNPWKNVPVRFQVESGDGFLAQSEVYTDSEGLASTYWVMGPSGLQEVRAFVRRADGSSINGSPAVFKPSGFSNPPAACLTSDLVINASVAGNAITAVAVGGTPPYLFSLNGLPFEPGNDFTGLTGDKDYLVLVKDEEGCIASEWVFVP